MTQKLKKEPSQVSQKVDHVNTAVVTDTTDVHKTDVNTTNLQRSCTRLDEVPGDKSEDTSYEHGRGQNNDR